ncbi:MAG: putative selenate reductase subunit YgfK [Clostridiales bacterium]|nr:putative selenate reductase subunit YgfK [Clostridiales bacterium]
MSDIMHPIPFGTLMNWVLKEYKTQGTIFGVTELYKHINGKSLPIFTEQIETPFGPAAGPHTQLAQNLIAAYVGGSRFFEVKTVQIIDGEDLPVSKPCILAEDEGYNVEWSTELRVPEAFDEYVKAWFAIKMLSKQFGFGSPDGFVFNMSVGYDLAGIKSEKVNSYIDGMMDAADSPVWAECTAWAKENLAAFDQLDAAYIDQINPHVCTSITLSTLHGCPPDEIERISTYLITEKKLNTYIKCNPTLLGYEFARKTMDEMGYDYLVFDDHHFNADLQFVDAIPMFKRLIALCAETGVEFGLKLTNTFPVTIAAGELPGGEMYMSGKSLYPLSINLADRIEKEFDGKLRVSYSGGADQFNIGDIYDCGIWPITMATTLLKPGGYNRLRPIADILVNMDYSAFEQVDQAKLGALAKKAIVDVHHVKPIKALPSRKMNKDVPLVDCFIAPCSNQCPIHQDIPEYIRLVGEGKFDEALQVICEKNPLPFITGTICSHTCTSKCTRNFYDESVQIRCAKLQAAEGGFDAFVKTLEAGSNNGKNVAVIGGGPGGMAAAYFLAKGGSKVTIFEKRNALGGIVKHVIPAFRISDVAIAKDASLLEKLGVEVKLNTTVESARDLLSQGYTHVIVANGAWEHGSLRLEGDKALNVIEFLEKQKNQPETLSLGTDVVVIGGGNTAMDAARAAKKADGVKNVRLVYRRTKHYMPADAEELELAIEDGVEFCELLAPVSFKDCKLTCTVMELGAPDASGRRSPQATDKSVEVPATTVISAIGEKVDTAYFRANGVEVNERGNAVTDSTCSSNGIFVIGDAKRGPATVVEAIADATAAAMSILDEKLSDFPLQQDAEVLKAKRADLVTSECVTSENDRCLGCSVVCENCVDVCPNRANIAVRVVGMAKEQVVHVDKMCNECGNCTVFCPYISNPYKDKFTLFASPADMKESTNAGFCVLDSEAGKVKVRIGDDEYESVLNDDQRTIAPLKAIMQTVISDYSYCL